MVGSHEMTAGAGSTARLESLVVVSQLRVGPSDPTLPVVPLSQCATLLLNARRVAVVLVGAENGQ